MKVFTAAIILVLISAPAAEAPREGASPVYGGPHAVVLQYHFFGDGYPASTSVTVERFREHLELIRKTGCEVRPLREIVQKIRDGKPLPDPCVAITIDDAYSSVYDNAFPVLKEYGWPATVFVPTDAVDRGMGGYMSWDQIREMASGGMGFESHGHRHIYMVRKLDGEADSAWKKRIRADIEMSLDRLESELGERPRIFAYPYGEYDEKVKDIVEELGLAAFGQHSGPVWMGSDFAALPRFPVSGVYSEPGQFMVKLKSLPLPVVSARPAGPLLASGDPPPVLRLEIAPGDWVKGTLSCFVSGQGRADVKWVDRERGMVEAGAKGPLPVGRSRYNFTAASKSGGRYYWYSHPWIVNP